MAVRGRAPIGELTAEPFLATERGYGFREMFDHTFSGPVVREPVAEVSSIGTLVACVAAGMGCALLPSLAVRAQADAARSHSYHPAEGGSSAVGGLRGVLRGSQGFSGALRGSRGDGRWRRAAA
ncbi:LysR family transcriptional regulator substrate-binding protein [Streptomyces sp. NPDC001851]|uniref:LysR family transcriptional regulator substrate-binding protein n=1 Tax=Streptomyces sp. NPDC001851 TaxID=3154529 RepID=UPI00331CD5A7